MMWWYGDGDTNAWGYVLMTVSMIPFWALVIYGVIWLVRSSGRDDRTFGPTVTPEDVLAERFARGEIDEEEYRRRLETLRSHRRPMIQR
jgi:putative membrane protein